MVLIATKEWLPELYELLKNKPSDTVWNNFINLLDVKEKVTSCFDWNGGETMHFHGVNYLPHCLMFFWITGELPDLVYRTCRNQKCSNPLHLSSNPGDK